PGEKSDTPDQTQQAKHAECLLPADGCRESADNEGSQESAEPRKEPDCSLGPATFLKRKTGADHARQIGIGPRFAAAKAKPDQEHEQEQNRQLPVKQENTVIAKAMQPADGAGQGRE